MLILYLGSRYGTVYGSITLPRYGTVPVPTKFFSKVIIIFLAYGTTVPVPTVGTNH